MGVRTGKAFGAISLSYHVAPATDKGKERATVMDCDHIKINCDSRLAMHVRTVLHVWKFKGSVESVGNGTGSGTTTQVKAIPLRNARLALMNQSGMPICIS